MSNTKQCCAGCVDFEGGEKIHHRHCPYYKDSVTEMIENAKSKIIKSSAGILRNLPRDNPGDLPMTREDLGRCARNLRDIAGDLARIVKELPVSK